MFKMIAAVLIFLTGEAFAQSLLIVDQANPLAVDLSKGKYTLPPDVKADPYNYIAFCDPEPCSQETIHFKPIKNIMECGPAQTEVDREDMEFTTADGGLLCIRVPKCQ